MGSKTKIEWAHHTGNLWWGCQKVHAGCDHCYAETLSNRWGNNVWGPHAPRRAIASVWNDFKKWQLAAAKAGEFHRVFVGSMMDIFERPKALVDASGNEYPGNTGQLRDRFLNSVVPACPNLQFLLLTKRPQNIEGMIPESWILNGVPHNVMFGYSPVDQKTYDQGLPYLLNLPGRIFLSCEPLLGFIDLQLDKYAENIDWVIAGGESGPKARPMHPAWVSSLRDQCMNIIPFFFKQWGEWLHVDQVPSYVGPRFKYYSMDHSYWRTGKKAAGRLLDGREWNEAPHYEIPNRTS